MEKRHPNHPGKLSSHRTAEANARSTGEVNARGEALKLLLDSNLPLMVGGAYAFARYTGIYRDTKDLDLFLRHPDAVAALEILAQHGWRAERTNEVWLYKAFRGEWFVDLIFSSGNAVCRVEQDWFRFAPVGEVLGHQVKLMPAEEMIWSKAFVLERERYDGADIAHLIKFRGPRLDWARLLRRFDTHWELLLSHLILFRYVYPGERTSVPDRVMNELLGRAQRTVRRGNWPAKVCRGPFISSANYVLDITDWGYCDGRFTDGVEGEGQVHATRSKLENPDRSGG